MIRPVRLRLSRAKGFRLQRHSHETNGLPAINAARPHPLGNPFIAGKDGSRAYCVSLFGHMLEGRFAFGKTPSIAEQTAYYRFVRRHRDQMRGKNIACWCPLPKQGEPDICHAALLIEVFNR